MKPYPRDRDKKPVVVRHVKRVKPSPMSGKKKRELEERRKLRAELIAERGRWCEAKLPVCKGEWSYMYKLADGSQDGSPVDKSDILCLCWKCRQWVLDNPVEAIRLGLRKSRQVQSFDLYC